MVRDLDDFLGGIKVGSEGYSMDPSHFDAIKEYPRPWTNKEHQRWLGLCTSLGQFVQSTGVEPRTGGII